MSNESKKSPLQPPMAHHRPSTPTTISMGQQQNHFPPYSGWSNNSSQVARQSSGYGMMPLTNNKVNKGYDVVDLENNQLVSGECQVTSSSHNHLHNHEQQLLLNNHYKRRSRKREMATTMDLTMATTSLVLDQHLLNGNGRPQSTTRVSSYPAPDQWQLPPQQTRVSGLPTTSTMPVVSPQARHMTSQVSSFFYFYYC